MRKTLLSALAVAVLLGAANLGPGQEASTATTEPVLVISFSGYDEVLKDLEFIGKLAGNPQLAQMVEAGLKQSDTAGALLAGLDKQRPCGLVVGIDQSQLAGDQLDPNRLLVAHAFLPASGEGDLEGLVASAKEKLPEGAGIKVHAAVKGDWLFISNSAEALANAPADPVPMLDGLNEQYDLAVRVNVKNIPPPLRQMALAPLQMGMQMGMQQMPGETDEQFALRSKMTQQAMQQMTTLLNELDALSLGLAVDRTASTGYFDYVITAVEGTKTAQQLAQAKQLTTNFAGFVLPGAAVTLNAVSQAAPSQIAQVKTMIASIRASATSDLENQGLSDAELKQAKKVVEDLFSVLEATLESGRTDIGMSLVLDSGALTFVAGSHVAESDKLETLIKDLAGQIVQQDPQLANAIKLDAEVHQGVRFHRLALPTEQMAEEVEILPQLVGQTLEVVVGAGPDSVCLAAGRNAADTLKGAIDRSKAEAGKPVPPMRLAVAATPIANFVAQVGNDQAKGIAAMVAEVLKQSGGKDHLTVTTTLVPNGAKTRLEIEEGLLKVIGSLPMLLMGAGGG